MLTTSFLTEKFSIATDYAKYLATGTDEHQRRWKAIYDRAKLAHPHENLVRSFTRQMNIR
jgi:hypothetical protein